MPTDDQLPESPPPPAHDSPTSPPAADSPAVQWFGRLGLSGKLLLFGSVAGVIATYFPLISLSVDLGDVRLRQSVIAVNDDWRGALSVLGYVATIVLAILLYPPARSPHHQNLCWAAVAVGAALVLLAVGLLIYAARIGLGSGAVLNLLAAGTVAAGAVWKAHDERLI